MKQWNIGNTTIRNPNRIKDGLVLLKSFEGRNWDYELQVEFNDEAIKREIMESGEVKEGGKAFHSRKWVSCLNQLGFARAWKSKAKGPVVITEVGNQVIKDEITFEEAMLRQLLKYQLPSVIQNDKKYSKFKVHPFRVFLEVINGLYQQNISGLTKEEIGLYVITTLRDDLSTDAIKKIAKYRNEREAIKGGNPKLKYYKNKKKEVIADIFFEKLQSAKKVLNKLIDSYRKSPAFLKSADYDTHIRPILFGKEPKKQKMMNDISVLISANTDLAKVFDYYLDKFVSTKGGTLQDYADSQVRYVMTTGLFTLNRDRIVIKPNKVDFIASVLLDPPDFKDEKEYLDYFYNPELPKLPSDDEHFMVLNVGDLQDKLEKLSEKTGIEVEPLPTVERSVPKLKKISQELEIKLIEQKEFLFYKDQALDQQIDDIVEYFELIKSRTLLGGDAYFPAYYEWAIWRVFLAINTLVGTISDTRNFQIDDELKPIHHAKGGVPDMVFHYDDFAIVCEATLLQSVSQFEAEYAAVPRHVGEVSANLSGKPVFGVFIAPRIEPDMAQQLFIATRYLNGELVTLNIVPFSTEQIVKILLVFKEKKFTVQDLKRFFEKLIQLKDSVKNGKEWYGKISEVFLGSFEI